MTLRSTETRASGRTTIKYALDISNYTGVLSDAKCQAILSAGYDRIIPQITNFGRQFYPDVHDLQIDAGRRNGLKVDWAYQWLFWDETMAEFEARLQAGLGLGIKWVSLDVEHAGYDVPYLEAMSVADRVDRIWNALHIIERNGFITAPIYSAGWFWDYYLRGVTEFSGYPGWGAQYDAVANLGNMVPYGGWTQFAVKQFGSGSLIAPNGVVVSTVDFNVYNEALFETNGGSTTVAVDPEVVALIDAHFEQTVVPRMQAVMDVLRQESDAKFGQVADSLTVISDQIAALSAGGGAGHHVHTIGVSPEVPL